MSNNPEQKIAPTLIALKVGESAVFPVERYSSIRSTASIRTLDTGMSWTTKIDREARTITVTRTK